MTEKNLKRMIRSIGSLTDEDLKLIDCEEELKILWFAAVNAQIERNNRLSVVLCDVKKNIALRKRSCGQQEAKIS